MIELAADDIDEVVSSIWETMLGLPVVATGSAQPPSSGREVCATVQLTGGWDGVVVIRCDRGAASVFTAAMLDMELDAPGDDEVCDVMGELANMAGGSLKARLRQDSALSLPTVAVGAGLELTVPGATAVLTTTFACAETWFSVVLLTRPELAMGSR